MLKTVPITKLEMIRRQAGYSKHRLARESGVNRITIIRLEQHGQQPHPSTRFALASALGCKPEDLEGHVAAGAA